MKRKARRLIPLLAIAALPVACGDDEPTAVSTLEQRLEQARARWEMVGFTYYDYSITYACFCGFAQEVLVRVAAGEVESAIFAGSGEAVPEGIEVHFPTIEGLFDFLASSLAENPDEASIEFDPGLGVPIRASFDFSRLVADDEISFVLRFLFTA